ncbi:hypothetical protein N2152v2_008621 [Parachlorella kessleri]
MDIWDSSSQLPSLPLRLTWAATYVGFILVNVASSLGWLGATNKEISDKFEVPLTPAGWAFSIWGVIFLLEGVGTVYQLISAGYSPDGWKERFVNSVGLSWVVSWLLASGWQFAFAAQTPGGMWLALLLVLGAFLAMARGLVHMYRLRHQYGSAPDHLLYVAYFLPTSINAAWLSVATAVQLLIALHGSQRQDDLQVAAVLLAALVAAGGGYLVLQHRDTAYGLTLIWAFVAVYEKTGSLMVRNTAVAALAAVGAVTLLSVLRRRPVPGGGIPLQSTNSADIEARQPLREEPSSGRD